MLKLHPFQSRNVGKICALQGPRHLFVLDETGLGKSVTAIAAAKRLGVDRMLVATKGMVRPGWFDRFEQWWPERANEVGSICAGRTRVLGKAAEARRNAAYNAPIQVVSYDLLPQVDKTGWDLIVLDEIHEHVSYRSQTSQALRDIFINNPDAAKLGLTATLVSAEPRGSWNMLSLFWPKQWGKARPNGEPPYWFLETFCERIETEWGVDWRGLNKTNAAAFAKAIAAVSVRTLRSEVAGLLPPIDCEPLVIEASSRKTDAEVSVEWASTAARESTHVSIFSYFRESAQQIASNLRALPRFKDVTIACVDGSLSPEKRAKVVQAVREAPRGILVGTMDSLATGISLSMFPQYLIGEVTATAHKLVQAIGRFSRLDSQTPSRGFVLLREGRDDDKIARLRRRLEDFNTLVRNGQGEAAIASVLQSTTEGDAFDRRLDDLIQTFRGDVDCDDDEED